MKIAAVGDLGTRLGRDRSQWLGRETGHSAAGETGHSVALNAAADKVGRHLFDVRLRLVVQAPANAEKRAKRKLREIAGAFGQFTSPRLSRFLLRRIRRCNNTNMKPLSNGFLLSDEELATLWHPAKYWRSVASLCLLWIITRRVMSTLKAPTMRTNDSGELEAPTNIGSRKGEGETLLASAGVLLRPRERGQAP